MKYQPPSEFEKIANPDFSYFDTVMFMGIGDLSENENDLVSEIHAMADAADIALLCDGKKVSAGFMFETGRTRFSGKFPEVEKKEQ